MSDGQLRKHERFRSKFLRNQRDLIVYLPPGYEEQSWRHFPVLYLHDGQNLFDGGTSFIPGMDWHVGPTADHAIHTGQVEPLIIVGMYNTKARIREYTPTQVPKLGGGRADRYAKFLMEEVKPFVDQEYRTLSGPSHTGIGGSSLGGLVSLYLGLKHSRIFGRIAALSPSVWWNQRVMHKFAAAAPVEPRPRIWLDIGTREGPRILDDVENFRDVLLEKGWVLERDLHYERVEGAEHNEAAWAARVGPFLRFLFPMG
ncbi:MAG TPA: alpha/beta hydrolase-fold protein [Candidatus Saccharimonadales bacterium]|nr:alpha/beta hydrolase-fold protein [Candidatus Saccharimonadales bacterium]